jgi:hypothetical protein
MLWFGVPRWFVLAIPAVACDLWAAWAWGRVDPYSFSWTTSDVLAAAMFGLLLGEAAATVGVVAGRVRSMPTSTPAADLPIRAGCLPPSAPSSWSASPR